MPRKYIPPPPPPPPNISKYPMNAGSMCIIAETCTTMCCLRKALDRKEFFLAGFFTPTYHTPPPPPTTLIPHIEVGFKWMWTQLATPNKMAPVFVDLCAGLVVLLPRQIRRFRHGVFSSAVLDWSLRSCLRVRHLWRQQIADNRQCLRRSFLPWTSSLRSQISLSKRR